MGLVIFATYFWSRVKRCSMTHQDAATALALYFVYPAILYLLIDKFHGLCGPQAYLEKAEAIAVNESFYMPFTALMRTHKILSIILYQAQQQTSNGKDKDDEDDDAKNDEKKRQSPSRTTATTRKSPSSKSSSGGGGNRKRNYSFEDDDTRRDDYHRSGGGGSRSDDETGFGGNGGRNGGSGSGDENYSDSSDDDSESDGSYDDEDDDDYDDDDDDDDDDGCTRQKCRVWFHLSQELTAVCCVAFLLLVCLPVLAFWFMFLGIIASSVSLLLLLKRVWREAHVSTFAMMPAGTGGMSSSSADKQNTPEEEEEFQEFLKNFT